MRMHLLAQYFLWVLSGCVYIYQTDGFRVLLWRAAPTQQFQTTTSWRVVNIVVVHRIFILDFNAQTLRTLGQMHFLQFFFCWFECVRQSEPCLFVFTVDLFKLVRQMTSLCGPAVCTVVKNRKRANSDEMK